MSSNKISISFIIVNHNTGSILKQCVESVYEYEKNIGFEIIIVDQNSADNSRAVINELISLKKNIKKIFLDEVKSFSYANNRGYAISSGNYILIMNPDIIFTQSVLQNLVGLLDQPDVGAVCPMLVGKDGKFQSSYFQRYPTVIQFILFYSFLAKIFLKSSSLINKYLENRDINQNSNALEFVEQIPCAFFFTKRSIFERAGKMDESYILFFEDVDLSYQIRKKYKLAINTSLRVTHLGGVSFRNEDNWWMYGRFILSMNNFFEKNYSWFKAFILKVISVKNSLLLICVEYVKKVFNKSDDYRLKKHKYYLKEFRKRYF